MEAAAITVETRKKNFFNPLLQMTATPALSKQMTSNSLRIFQIYKSILIP